MTHELLAALIAFAFVSSITPGPNNLMLMASGANFGFRRTIAHMLGISLGHALMVFLVGLGIAGLFTAIPATKTVLKVVSVLYMLWLAFKVATSATPAEGRAGGQPMTFLQAAAFQWVNPKAWYMAIFAITNYAANTSIAACAIVAVVFACTNLPSVSVWAWMGQELRRWLTNPARLRAFNWTMAALLVASLIPVLQL
jgi:threonine/homoserine/homoserine lactone efflux protein